MERARCCFQTVEYLLTSAESSEITSRFSEFDVSALFVKLNDPVMTVLRSRIMTLLWAILKVESMKRGIPLRCRDGATEAGSESSLRSSSTRIWAPRWWAAMGALAIGVDVKE